MSKRVTLLNNKGGVGKTLAAVGLAEAAARAGARVLVVDMDPQANATRRLRVVPEGERTLTRCLRSAVLGGAVDFIVHHGRPGQDQALPIDVLPADLDLEDRTLEAGLPGSWNRLRRVLFDVDEGRYDVTVVDCPPSIKGHLTTMAIAALDGAGDAVVVTLEPEADAIKGARRSLDYIRLYQEELGVPGVEIAGVIVNKVTEQTRLHRIRIGEIPDHLSVPVLASIPRRTRIAETQDAGLSLCSDPSLAPVMDEFTKVVKALGVKTW